MSNVDEVIAQIIECRDKSSELERMQDELKEQRAQLEAHLMEMMASMGITQLGGAHGTASMSKRQKPVITDNDAFRAHILATGDLGFLQNRLAVKHVAEIFDAGEEVPGVGLIEEFTVSIKRK